ncbi:hypothetical protein [Rhodoferax sp.]|uniref:hypothetical protein n=1 Tax=Rhodoferax sp. TaxID=50421 RepID=UPI0025F30230|nr:hypothetical protein [Rhodoferax sp.]
MTDNNPTSDPDAALQATLRAALHTELAHMDPEAGLAQLHARLKADTAHIPSPLGASAGWRDALRGWFTRWPTALASLVIVLQAGLLAWQMQPPQQDVIWRGTGVDALGSAPNALLVVHFAPQAPLQAVTTLLHSLRAEAIAGPDEDGLWTLAVPTTQRDAALAQLRASPLVQAATAP